MDGCAGEIEPWRQVFLGAEPIYCAAPSPSRTDDIICHGSDDGTDEATGAAKRARYEEHGRRYLQGRPPRILSASLRGPFDAASGWQNPWVPKPSSYRGQQLEYSSQPPVASSAIRLRDEIPADRQSSGGDEMIQDLYDSMQCHLPSPQSHQDLQFFDNPTHFEKRSLIQSWANNVCGDILEKDNFWAPNSSAATHNVESATKRPACRDWLKRRSAKKMKLNASQSTEATRTPTPNPSTQPRSINRQGPVTRRHAKRSFEMTTPSSSPDQAPEEPQHSVEHQPRPLNEEDNRPAVSSIAVGGNQLDTGLLEQSREEENGNEGDEEDEEEAENARASGNMCQDRSMEQTSRHGDEMEEAADFQECADESFIYRARQGHQATVPATSNETIMEFSSPNSQTTMPTLPEDGGAVNLQSDPHVRESNSNATCDHIDATGTEYAGRLNEPSVASTINNGSDNSVGTAVERDNTPLQSPKVMLQTCGTTDEKPDTNRQLEATSDQFLRETTPNKTLDIHDNISQVKETRCASTEPFLDEGPTLLGDPTDAQDLGYLELTPQDPSTRLIGSSLLEHYAISATNMVIDSQVSRNCDGTTPNEINYTTGSTEAAIPQQESTDSPSTTSEPRRQGSPEETTSSVIGADAIIHQDDVEDIPQIMAQSQAIPAEQQSPWMPKPVTYQSTQYGNDHIRGVESTPEQSLVQSDAILLDPLGLVDCDPTIRPSQQSPWAQEVAEPANAARLEEISIMGAAIIMDLQSPEKQSPPLPVDQGHLCWTTSPTTSPVPGSEHQSPGSAPAAEEPTIPSIVDVPYTPITRIVRPSTPDGEVSIRSFSNFQFPSPQQSAPPPSSSVSRSILKSGRSTETRSRTSSSRRVLFAPLSHEEGSSNDEPCTKSRAASPPPSAVVDIEEENISGRYQNHFTIMNRRLSLNAVPSPRYHQRLLPSSSQQKPQSPSVNAMADAFRQADAQQAAYEDSVAKDIQIDREEQRPGIEEMEGWSQSPWQQDSQGVDDVADVMGNINDFLDVWDVETEMDRQRAELELNEMENHGVLSNNTDMDMGLLQGVGIW
ncbi:hypothetical protein F5Y14DRAFT_410505 [Nemania sp. NC0429]|nr:hypothetical protein F5Y14DRAFT_410505 [Nemania sp. NC0429]